MKFSFKDSRYISSNLYNTSAGKHFFHIKMHDKDILEVFA